MPTNRIKRKARRRGARDVLERSAELYLWSGFDLLDGQVSGLDGDARACRATWGEHGADSLARYVAQYPGRRPWAWWQFEAPEPRQWKWSPDFLIVIEEPESCYLDRLNLWRKTEQDDAERLGLVPVIEQERKVWAACRKRESKRAKPAIAAGKLVLLTRARNARDHARGHERGLWWDEDAARKVCQFFDLMLRHSKGEWAGLPFRLSILQRYDIIRPLFGWMRLPDEMAAKQAAALPFPERLRRGIVRRYRKAYLEMCRKNGKSTLMSGIALYLGGSDGEAGAEIYSAATKKDQAKLVHTEAVRMRAASPDLAEVTEYRRSINEIEWTLTYSTFVPLGSDSDTLDGLNSHGNIVDELHSHRDETVYDKLITGTGARRQPLTVAITTAGERQDGVCYRERSHVVKVLEGHQDDSYFGYIACIDREADWKKSKEWVKANPNLGISVKLDYLVDAANKASTSPSDLNTFLRMHCGIWTQGEDYWLPMMKWDACHDGSDPVRARDAALERCRGRICGAGLDLGSTADLTSLSIMCADDDGAIAWFHWGWCPEENAAKRARNDRAPYVECIRDGWLRTTPGDRTDYDLIEEQILQIFADFDVQQVNGDALFQAQQLYEHLFQRGAPMHEFPQTITYFAAPTKLFEEQVLGGTLRHFGNPLLRWMACNCVAWTDNNLNKRPDKKRSTEKIDGIVSGVMALAAYEDVKENIGPGILVF